MSTENAEEIPQGTGFPELTALGKHIELLRIERGLSKQHLARAAGTSRQQLWRVMTGKSELTLALCHRLAEVLQVDPPSLREGGEARRHRGLTVVRAADEPAPAADRTPVELEAWVTDSDRLLRTLETLPVGEPGGRLKRELLNCVEDVAREADVRLPGSFFELRGRVINGEI
jgi:transcriptional regulator with XRE-family HTH domain